MAAERSTYIRRARSPSSDFSWSSVPRRSSRPLRPDNTFRLRMYTDTLAGGIGEGTGVVVNGAEIGTVRTITPTRTGEFVVDLAMDPDLAQDARHHFDDDAPDLRAQEPVRHRRRRPDSVPGGEPIASGETSIRIPRRCDADVDAAPTQRHAEQGVRPLRRRPLNKADRASMAFMPVLDILGRLTGALVETEQIPVEVTLPKIRPVQGPPAGVDNLMTSLNGLMAASRAQWRPGTSRPVDQGRQPRY